MNTITGNGYKLTEGDCVEVMAGMDAGSVDAIVVDLPYGIDYQSARRSDKTQWKPKIANDKKPFTGWHKDIIRLTHRKSCGLFFYRWDVQNEFVEEIKKTGMQIKSQVIWDKLNHGMGDLSGEFAPQHESILFSRYASYKFPNKRPKTIIRYPRIHPDKLVHPNEKPVGLIVKLIKSVTREGDTVLDFTCGSGSTGVAAIRTGRKFIGIEQDAEYFEIARQRIANAAGDYVTTPAEKQAGKVSLFGW